MPDAASETPTAPSSRKPQTPELLAAGLITLIAGFLFLNGSLFSTVSSSHVDFSINWTAAHALRSGDNPYGITTLAERAGELGGPTDLIYGQLFTSYIQPPTSALAILPLSYLSWRNATRAWLLANHVFLIGAVALTLMTLRPSMAKHWLVAGAAVLLLAFSQIYGSFALGQVDATQVLLLSIGFWGYVNGRHAVTGISVAAAAAIKLIPGLLLVYFLWRGQYRTVLWGAGAGLVLLLASMAIAGWDTYHTYLSETVPALAKGSTHYSNAGLGAVNARLHTPDPYRGLPKMIYLDEVPSSAGLRVLSIAISLAGLAALAIVIPRRRPNEEVDHERATTDENNPRPEALEGRGHENYTAPVNTDVRRLFWEYYFVIAVGLLISSVTWEFYVVWLLPVFVAAFLCPERVLPSGNLRYVSLGVFVLALVLLNYPGDMYLFVPNGVFYHPSWVPGVFVEDRLQLYHKHLDAVLFLRLPGLLLLAGMMALLIRLPQRFIASSPRR